MVKDLIEQKSANISHSPAILSFSHKQKESKVVNIELTKRVAVLGLFFGIIYLYERSVHKLIWWAEKKLQFDDYLAICKGLNLCLRVIHKALVSLSIFHLLKVISGAVRTLLPSYMFFPALIKNLSFYISLLYALAIKNFYVFVNEFSKVEHNESMLNFVLFSDCHIFRLMEYLTMDFLVRDAIITTLNYLVHYRYYEDRINNNTDNLNILMDLNSYAGLGFTIDIEPSVEKIFELISSNGSIISVSDLNRTLGEAKGNKLFSLCKAEDQDHITKEELTVFYISTLTEQALIEKSINYNNYTVDCFKTVLNVLLSVIIAIQILNITSEFRFKYIKLLNDPSTLVLTIFSVNYASSDSLKSFLTCLYFIFFVRPYEIGDMISYNGQNYLITEINLLTTSLFDGNSFTLVPNSKMIAESITNMRLNKVWKEELEFTFNYQDFEQKSQLVIEKLSEMTKKKPTVFRKAPYFKDLKLVEDNKVKTTLVVRFNTEAANIEKMRERRNMFVSGLGKILNSEVLNPV